jgi:cyclophilin family peptidyl-prolyl cis-trans isomerase
MSQNVSPPIEGDLEAPNPLELFWEQNKRVVTFGLIAAAAALAIHYLVQYQGRRAQAERWSAFASATGLDRAYANLSDTWASVQSRLQQIDQMTAQNPNMAQSANFQRQMVLSGFYQDMDSMQIADLDETVEAAQVDTLREIIAGGDDRAPLALWVLANRAYFANEFDEARGHVQALQKGYPGHFLVVESNFPVQWRDEVKKDDDAEESGEPKDEKPEYVAPVAGSIAGQMLARIDVEQKFRQENPRFFEAAAPTSAETITIEFENAGTVKIKLFDQATPGHAAKFLELAKAGWWSGMRVHEIRREPQPNDFNRDVPDEIAFGWASTKDEDDRTKWVPGDVAEEHVIDWEDSNLSHFPGTVAVEVAKEGRSQVERVVINGDDAAATSDGNRVIVGRVVEGLDVVLDMVNGGFADATSVTIGRGKPEENYVIKSVTIE